MADDGQQHSEDPRESLHVTPRVLVFFDYACQFCYLDWPRFKRLRAEHEADLFLIPFELRPTLGPEGVPVSEIGPGHSDKVLEHMHRMASEGGLTLVHPELVPSTHLALALGEFARDIGEEVHEAVHEAIFSAYSGRGEDIGDRDVLLGIAEGQGLDPAEVAAAFDEGRYDDRLHQFYHVALGLGISATPSALICNELLIGSRPYGVLAESLEHCIVNAQNVAEHTHEPATATAQAAEGAPPTIAS